MLVGRNGFGKTNVLEALYYIANLRSHRVTSDAALVSQGAQSARIATTVHNDGRELSVDVTILPAGANKVPLVTTPLPVKPAAMVSPLRYRQGITQPRLTRGGVW